MYRKALLVLFALILPGCDHVDDAANMALGLKHQRIPLAGATVVGADGFRLRNQSIKVLGKDSSVCLSISGIEEPGNPLSLLGESTLSGYMVLKDGKKVSFISIGKSWSAYGQGGDPDKPAICLVPEEGWAFKSGQVVDTIVVQATPQIQVQDIYWESWNADELFKAHS